MKAYEIMNLLEQYFPLHLQMGFDKCGLQVGNRHQDIQKVYLALNADCKTLQECIDAGCQMMITHHPFLLETINCIDVDQHQGQFIQMAIKNDIVVYSLHTCLDRGQNGISMNDWLISKLPVHDVECYDELEVGKKAYLDEVVDGKQWVEIVKNAFGLKHFKYSSNTDIMIKSVAICGGSAADDLEALAGQVDCYITGDTKYRHAKYAIDHHCLLIDAGHHLEVIFEEEVNKILVEKGISTVVANSQDYFIYE